MAALILVELALLGVSQASALEPAKGGVVLTVTGAISNTNAGNLAEFDLSMLETVSAVSFEASTIWTEGAQGRGSSFGVRLPLPSPSEPGPSEAPETVIAASEDNHRLLRPHKILVVEDNRINRVVVRDMLERDAHQVDEATDGRPGVDCVRRKSDDLVFMDISMPVMNGIEATREIRTCKPVGTHLPSIAITANVVPSEQDRFMAAGRDNILIKPMKIKTLREVIGRLFSSANTSLKRFRSRSKRTGSTRWWTTDTWKSS